MTTDPPLGEFTRPAPESVVTMRRIGATLFATVVAPAISSVEAPVVDDRLREVIADAPAGLRHLVLDVRNVAMVNSMALGVLVGVYTSCKHRNIQFILTGLRDNVLDLLVTTKMDSVFTICRTPEELEKAIA
ncbi:MAG: STAS domain-containing protein [Planctomycetota bacterium]|jgi:anti-anti-sigma factor